MKRSMRAIIILFAIYLALGLLITAPSSENPWFFDDLHLVRSYSDVELMGAWSGSGDPDMIETPGYRPLMTLYNHLTYGLFGENPLAYRRLAVVETALALAFLGAVLSTLAVPVWVSVLGGVLFLTAKNTVYFLVWPSDAYHTLQGVLFGASAFLLAHALTTHRGRAPALIASAALVAPLLLLKEQAISLIPLLLCLPVWSAALAAAGDSNATAIGSPLADILSRVVARLRARWFLLYALSLVALAVAALAARTIFVPEAQTRLALLSSLHSVEIQTSFMVVLPGFGYGLPTALLYWSLAASIGASFLAALRLLSRGFVAADTASLAVAFLFTATLAALSNSFAVVKARSDLAYFPLIFYGLTLATGGALAYRSVPLRWRGITMLALVSCALLSGALSIKASVGVQEALGPRSVQLLATNYEFLYSASGQRATIPAPRRAAEIERLKLFALESIPVDQSLLQALYCRAVAQAPSSQKLFVPTELAFGDDGFSEMRVRECR